MTTPLPPKNIIVKLVSLATVCFKSLGKAHQHRKHHIFIGHTYSEELSAHVAQVKVVNRQMHAPVATALISVQIHVDAVHRVCTLV